MYNNQNPNYGNQNNRRRPQNTKKPAQRKNATPQQKNRRNSAARTNDYDYNYYGGTAANHSRQYRGGGYRRRKTRVRFNIAKYIYRLLIILIFAVMIAAVTGTLFYINLTKTKKNPDIIYEFIYGEDKSQKIQMPFEIAFSNGEYYIPINDIMSKLDCNITGDKNEISFISAATNNFMKFKVNSPIVYVNNVEYHMTSPSVIDGSDIASEKLYVPMDFVRNKFDNLTVTQDEKNENHFVIEISNIESFAFKLQAAENLKNPLEGVELPPLVEFAADLSESEQYFSPENRDEYLTLINQTHPLEPQDYVPPDLIDVADTRKDGRAMQQLRLYPAKALEAFLTESRANGIENITVTSAYRSYESQSSLFNTRVTEQMAVLGSREAAEAEVSKLVAYPGHSEHQSGLCLDMHTLGSAVESFGETPAGKWLAENAHHFGFIVRYPQGKTDITGILYEPWHFRYVGVFHATRMYDLGMCLEEYIEYLDGKKN